MSVDKAILLSAQGHLGQRDKGKVAYILHPIRIMMRLRTTDEELMSIAMMHDLVEDNQDFTAERLRVEGFSERVIAALVLLTHHKDVDYFTYIENMAHNLDALLVKREDLRDNSDITRLKGLRQKDFDRMAKYIKAFALVNTLIQNYTTIETFKKDHL